MYRCKSDSEANLIDSVSLDAVRSSFFRSHTFYKKVKSGPSTESFLASGGLEYSKFLNSFLTIFLK